MIYITAEVNVTTYGIGIFSRECIVENNTITGCPRRMSALYTTTFDVTNSAAIRIGSDDCRIVNNSIIDNYGYGIWVTGKRNIIYGNTIIGNSLGNSLSDGEDNQWDNGIDTGNYWEDWSGTGVYNIPGEEGCVDRFPMGESNSIAPVITTVLLLIGGASVTIIALATIRKWRVRNQPA